MRSVHTTSPAIEVQGGGELVPLRTGRQAGEGVWGRGAAPPPTKKKKRQPEGLLIIIRRCVWRGVWGGTPQVGEADVKR